MRLCVPTETNKGATAQVYGHFGSAPFFTIYDTTTKRAEIIDNANQHHAHGACHPMASLDGKKIDAVVCGGMGARAVQRLNEAGLKAYRAIPGTVEEIAAQFVKGGLEEITPLNGCMGHGCH